MDWKNKADLCEEVVDQAAQLYKLAGLGERKPENLRKAFAESYEVVFCMNENRLIGVGRVISDGIYYASIFDVAIDPEFQGQGLGRKIMERLMATVPNCNIHLTSTFGNEEFYQKLGFRRHKTAMAKYEKDSPYLE